MIGSRPVGAHLAKPGTCAGSGNLGHRGLNAPVRIPRREQRRGFSGRVLLAVCAVAVVVFAASAERAAAQTVVTIPDDNLRERLESVLMKAPGTPITRTDMAGLVSLDLQNAGIGDLTGLEYAVNLITLALDGNELSDCIQPCTGPPVLTPLAGLTQLATLGLDRNQISDLTPLAGLPYLRTLDVSSNRISDLTPLARLTSLTTLELADNRISDLMPLAGLIHLTALILQGNRITDLSPLASLTAVTNLFLNNNPVTDLTPLPSMTSLSYLTLSNCWLLTDLSPLESMTSLQRLSVDGTAIEDIGPLARSQGFTQSIARIDLRDNPNLNADTAGHVTTLRGRTPPVDVIAHSPLTLNRVVRNVMVTPGVTSLTVTWDALSTASSFNPTGYRVQWKSAGELFTIRATPARHYNSNGLSTTSYTIPNLDPAEYGVRVRPTGAYGPSSAIVYGTPWPVLRDMIVEPRVSAGPESLVVSWNRVVGAADYKVQWKSGEEEYNPARQATVAGGDTPSITYTIPNLIFDVEYTVRVIAVRADRREGPPAERRGTPLLGKVSNLNIVPKTKSLVVSWNPVVGAVGYRIQWKSRGEEYDPENRDPTVAGEATVAGADTTHYTIDGLTPQIEYTGRVIAVTNGPDGPPSDEETGTPGESGTGESGKLSSVTGLRLEEEVKSLVVSWNRVVGAVGYTIQWKSGEEEYPTPLARQASPDRSDRRQAWVGGADTRTYTIRDLTPGVLYTVRVIPIATTADRDGDPKDAEEATKLVRDRDEERRVLSMVLAGVGRTLATDAVEILSSRSGTPVSRLSVTLGGQVLRLTDPPPAPSSDPPSPLGRGAGGEGPPAAPATKPGASPWQRVTGVAVGVARALGVAVDVPSPLAGAPGGEGRSLQGAQRLPSRFPAGALRRGTGQSLLRIQPVSVKDLLARSAFDLPLTNTGEEGVPAWTLWGRGAASGFSGEPQNDFTMTGNLYSGYVGVDYRPKPAVLLGLAVAHSTGGVDYTLTGSHEAAVDVEMTSILPYAHWQPTPSLGVWSMLGAGWGDMAVETAGAGLRRTTDLSFYMGAVGGRQALITWRGIDVAAKTDAFLSTVKSDGTVNLAAARGHARRMRLLMEGRTAVDLSPVSRVQPRLEVGGRWDSGTAEQGLGLELGGGLTYTQTAWGLSISTQGRYLLAHQDGNFEDWGASLNLRVDPGDRGQGAWLTVTPVWGQAASGTHQLWEHAMVPESVGGRGTPAERLGWQPQRLNVDIGYGIALAGNRRKVTPYGGMAMTGPGTSRYRLGSRVELLVSRMGLNVEGERANQPGRPASHGVSVNFDWQW